VTQCMSHQLSNGESHRKPVVKRSFPVLTREAVPARRTPHLHHPFGPAGAPTPTCATLLSRGTH
jgi:hypothetical protein